MKYLKLALRLIVLPFFSAIGLVYCLVMWGMYTYNFLRHGGETLAYTKRTKPKTIADVYLKLEDLLNKEPNPDRSVATDAP